jgi:serine/threonine protein phosphatase PrpC
MTNATSRIETASLTNVGMVRTKNQDSCGEFQAEDGTRLLVVADGMGGHRGGEVASAAAIDIIGKHFAAGVEDPHTFLKNAFDAANREIMRLGTENANLARMGTTGVAILILPDLSAWVANVGDSRAYRLRGHHLESISEDHSWVADQVRAGRMSEEEAADHPRRNVLSRCIGIQPDIEIDIDRLELEAGDQYLLCSDGLWGLISETRIIEILEAEAPTSAVETLIRAANDAGGQDNITAQIARVPGRPARDVPTTGRLVAPQGAEDDEENEAAAATGRSTRTTALAIGAALLLLAALLLWAGR